MIWKQLVRTARQSVAGFSAMALLISTGLHARADVVTAISTTSQENRLSLFHDYSINALGQSTGSIPGSAGSGLLTPMMGQFASTDVLGPDRQYSIAITPLAGYDSNPEARRFGRGGEYVGGDLSLAYQCNIGPYDANVGSPNQFRISYDITGAVYSGQVSQSDPLQQTLAWSYRRSLFNDRVYLGLGINDQFTMLHGSATLNTLDVIPSAEWFLTPQASVEVNYDYTDLSFFPPEINRRDENSDRHIANLKLHLYSLPHVRGPIPESPDQLGDFLRQTLTSITIGYGAIFNEPVGAEYRYEGNRVSIGVSGMRIPRIKALPLDLSAISVDAFYAHEWDTYFAPSTEGPIILSGGPRQTRRKDHIDVFTLRTNARFFDLPHDRGTLTGFVQWDLIADRSNIAVRHYNEYVISGGLTFKY